MSVTTASTAGLPPFSSDPHLRGSHTLTTRERTVLRLLTTGMTDKEIAYTLCIGRPTASKHVQAILRKLGVSSRVSAAAIAARAGLS